MNYLLKNKHKDTRVRRSILMVVLILGLAWLFYYFIPNFSSNILYGIARPIWIVRDFVLNKFDDIGSAFSDKASLALENRSLKTERDEANLALLDLDSYKKENAELKSMLGRSTAEKSILAVIITKPNRTTYDTLVLDVGEKQGVKKGDTVISGDFIIGRIGEVFSEYSKAVLVSSSGEAFTVRIGDSGVDTPALGRGGGNFFARLPKDVKIEKGDLVKSAEIRPRFFGRVEEIEQTETGSFQFVLFKLPVNLNTLEWVEIVRSR